jgi:hypothetical protein
MHRPVTTQNVPRLSIQEDLFLFIYLYDALFGEIDVKYNNGRRFEGLMFVSLDLSYMSVRLPGYFSSESSTNKNLIRI